MKHRSLICIYFITILFVGNAQAQSWKIKTENADYIHRAIKQVTDVMVYDIYSPPVTSRTYAYISVAAYETLIHANTDYISLASQLHGLQSSPAPDKGKDYSYTLAAVHALLTVGKTFVISEKKVDAFEAAMMDEFKKDGIPKQVFDNSVSYGKKIADHIIAWVKKDNYIQLRSLPQYTVTNDAGSWKPTPPAYIKAIEPNWNRLRTFIINSAQQFKPIPPPTFSIDTNSTFYKNAFAVYDMVNNNSKDQVAMANFWDCNPFKMNVRGHVMYATKKISPNGHWMNIVGVVCKKVKAGPMQSAEAYACVAVTLADCFISCWDEKYRSDVIRPETYINKYIDPAWLPVLQTPPFPEYTSGHSVISSGAAVILSKLFKPDFSFTDSTELEFGLPPRHFNSFQQAANEAAISRFYGGIHYMPAIKNGQQEGYEIGVFVSKKLKTRKK
jgi:hypothetical protein